MRSRTAMATPAHQIEQQSKLRLLVVDDHELFRICLRKTLEAEAGIEIAAEMSNGADIVGQVRKYRPDLILLDLDMPGVDGFTALQALADSVIECPVLVLTGVEDRTSLRRVAELGARGIVLKRSGIAEWKQAIHEIRQGRPWLANALPEWGRPAAGQTDHPHRSASGQAAQLRRIERWTVPSWSQLTPREREIAALVAQGMRYAEIARTLGISEQTVKNHIRHVFDKLEVTNRLQLALFVANRTSG